LSLPCKGELIAPSFLNSGFKDTPVVAKAWWVPIIRLKALLIP